jgi:hypothetical protein
VTEAEREASLTRLGEIAAELETAPTLYEERLAIFQALAADGVPHATIAEAARVSPKAVGFALGKSRKREEQRSA